MQHDAAASPSSELAATPRRTCVGCRARRPPHELLRFRRAASGEVVAVIERSHALAGRGAWLCPNPSCFVDAERQRAFARAFATRRATGSKPELADVRFEARSAWDEVSTRIAHELALVCRTGAQPLERSGAQPLERSGAQPLERSGAQPLERSGAQPLERSGAQPHTPSSDSTLSPRVRREALAYLALQLTSQPPPPLRSSASSRKGTTRKGREGGSPTHG